MLEDEIGRTGGRWVKLQTVADGWISGELVHAESREMSFEGQPVYKRNRPGEARREWVITLRVKDREDASDDGIRKIALKERAQSAVSRAVQKAGATGLEAGAKIALRVSKDRESEREQPEFEALYEPPAKVFAVAVAGDDPGDPPF
jgi:hypothetical protein